MTTQQERSYLLLLSQITNLIPVYYSYCIPWITIGCDIFSLGVLFFRKRKDKNINIMILKCQYIMNLIYALNMILNDNVFSLTLFNYILTQNVSDFVCKLHFVLMRYFYCMAPCMQMVYLYLLIFLNQIKILIF